MNAPFLDLVLKNRSIRRFRESERVPVATLRALVELARCSPSGANRQPLKFALSADTALNAKIFPTLAWAGYLTDWPGPAPGERPAAYIVIVLDKSVAQSAGCDHGIAAQSILLGASTMGLSGCMVGSVKRPELSKILGLGEGFDILLVLALGVPAETVVLEEAKNNDIRYYRTPDGVHHVPKRSLEELILPARENAC